MWKTPKRLMFLIICISRSWVDSLMLSTAGVMPWTRQCHDFKGKRFWIVASLLHFQIKATHNNICVHSRLGYFFFCWIVDSVRYRERGEGQTDAPEAIHGQSQKDECRQCCKERVKGKKCHRILSPCAGMATKVSHFTVSRMLYVLMCNSSPTPRCQSTPCNAVTTFIASCFSYRGVNTIQRTHTPLHIRYTCTM